MDALHAVIQGDNPDQAGQVALPFGPAFGPERGRQRAFPPDAGRIHSAPDCIMIRADAGADPEHHVFLPGKMPERIFDDAGHDTAPARVDRGDPGTGPVTQQHGRAIGREHRAHRPGSGRAGAVRRAPRVFAVE